MREHVVSIYLENDVDPIPDVTIKELKLYASIFSSYPGGEIVIDDPEGKFLSTIVTKPADTITIVSGPGDDNQQDVNNITPFYFGPMRVIGVTNKGVYTSANDLVQLGSLGGNYTIHLSHPWATNSDWSNHAYRAKTSAIINRIINNNARGFSFKSVTIDPTDDAGTTTRYKIGESEARFIHQKLLPYATIDKQASYSFVDEVGGFHLRSFLRMYNQEPRAIILPPLSDAVSTLWEDGSKTPQLAIYDGAWWIGRKFIEQIGNLKKLIYVEDSATQISFAANLHYKPAIPGYTLLKKDYVDNVKVTEVSIYPFRNFEDAIRLNVNNNGVMNEFFQVSITVDFAADLATVGQTLTLKFADATDTTKAHWLSGKWLIAGAEHFLKEGRYFTKYLVCRPALDVLPPSVTPESLYLYQKS
jgi:hypothetical protein